jgi:hypothetical protein
VCIVTLGRLTPLLFQPLLQLASRLHTERIYNVAATLASRRSKPGVAERISQLLVVRDSGAVQRGAAAAAIPAPTVARAPQAAAPTAPAVGGGPRPGFGLAAKSSAVPAAITPAEGAVQPPSHRPGAAPASGPRIAPPASSVPASTASALELVTSAPSAPVADQSRVVASDYGHGYGRQQRTDLDDADDDGGVANPFAKSIYQSPKRKRGAFDALAMSSPAQQGGALNRQSSIAVGARDKRLKEMQN